MNNLDMCQKTCKKILEIQPENESASVMMADIAFRKVCTVETSSSTLCLSLLSLYDLSIIIDLAL